jgi:hypothetical protein
MPYKDPLAQKAAQKAWYERNKELTQARTKDRRNKNRTYIRDYKLANSVCTDCGISYPPHVLDFDHLSDKSFQIGGNAHKNVGLDKIKQEIEKCEIVCSNCHRHRTYMRSINKPKNK